jgi:hypothetical protein
MQAFEMAWLKSLWRATVLMSSTFLRKKKMQGMDPSLKRDVEWVRPCGHKNSVCSAMFFFWWLMLVDEVVERHLSLLSE